MSLYPEPHIERSRGWNVFRAAWMAAGLAWVTAVWLALIWLAAGHIAGAALHLIALAGAVDLSPLGEWIAPTTALTLEDGVRLIEGAKP